MRILLLLYLIMFIKLPFDIDHTYTPDVLDPLPMSVEEIKKLKDDVEQAQREKENLEHELYDLARQKNQMNQYHKIRVILRLHLKNPKKMV